MSETPFAVSSPVRVLLIEDTEVDARVIERILRHNEFDVRRAERMTDALAALRTGGFDLILSDLGLPDSSGLQTLDTLRQHSALPLVVLTGRDDESTALRAVATGAQDYLVKGSTDANTLVRAIRYAVERGRAAEQIRESEARMRMILENALDAVVSINQNGVVVLWNRSAEEIFGRPRAEAMGRKLEELIIPERFRDAHNRAIRAFIDTGQASAIGKRVEWLALRADGSEFPVDVRITAEGDSGGMTFTAFIVDITERKRAEEERKASEAKFRALVENTYDVIFLCGADGTLTYVSPAVTRVLGYEPNELLGREPLAFVHREDVRYVAERFGAREHSIPLAAEFRFRHRDGSWRYLEVVRVNRLADPAVRAVVGTARDVTARKQAQQALDQLRRRYELILNSIGDGVHGVDLQGRIIFENPAAAAILGWQRSEMIGRDAHQLAHHSRPDGSPRPVTECPTQWTLADGTVRTNDDDVFWRSDGSPVRVEYTSAPMADDDGRITGAVVTFRDITRQKQLEQQVEHAARVASLGRVSASVAHEFNNVLMSIGPFAEALQRKAQDDASLEKPVRHVMNAVRRGQRLTEEILRFTNPPEPRFERIELASLIRNFADEARAILEGRTLAIELPQQLDVRGDADSLSQVLLNFVTNARDATKDDGIITIGAAPAALLPFVREQLPDVDRHAAIYVRDDGRGIAADAHERIFEPFFTAGKRRGIGLGLAIAARIAATHGGHILCESAPGAGSTFYVVLPECGRPSGS